MAARARAKRHVSIEHTECTCTLNPVAYSVVHPGMARQIRCIHHRVCSAVVAPRTAREARVSRTGIPSWYIRMYIRCTFGCIRVHSGYSRLCSTAAAFERGEPELVNSGVHSVYIRVQSEYMRLCSTAAAGERGQTQLVHSEVHSRYIRVHSGTFGVHSSLQRGDRGLGTK